MKDELFAIFRKTGKIKDYLKYREEVTRELSNDERNGKKKRGTVSNNNILCTLCKRIFCYLLFLQGKTR